jgi:hypothetical protein
MISGFEPRARSLDEHAGSLLEEAEGAVRRAAPVPGQRSQLPLVGQDWPEGTQFVELPSINDARRLLGPVDEAVRRRRSDVYFAAMPHTGRTRLQLGMHDRGEEYIFADGRICADDAAGHARHFPAHLKVVRLRSHRIGRGRSWDVSASHTAWSGVDCREELYVLVRVDRLVVEPGSSLEVHGNILVLECGEIEMHRDGASSRSQDLFEIRILPTRHPAFSRIRSAPGAMGHSGANGAGGTDGRTSVVGTPFGPILNRISPSQAGAPGADGEPGGAGGAGQNGGMTMLTDFRIGALVGFGPASLRVTAQAGAGRPGSAGGRGGNGGAGGKGGDGLDGVGGFIRGGLGGRGGNGGDGGDGGRGGNGGLGSNIFIQMHEADVACLDLRSLDSVGGPGGPGGEGGAGGVGGAHGALAEARPGEICAPSGADGREGAAGAPGKARAGPRMHVLIEP